MAITVASWNILDGFSNEERIEPIIDRIENMDVDVAVLPEAYDTEEVKHLEEVSERFKALGYAATSVPYEDADGRRDQHGLMVINRASYTYAKCVRLLTRNALELDIDGLRLLGVHYDDRSERQRLGQNMAAMADSPSVIFGDMNSAGRRKVLLKAFKAAAMLPARYPTAERPTVSRAEYLSSALHRAGAMAGSRLARDLHRAGYIDANLRHEATWPGIRPRLELDRIVTRAEVNVRNFKVHPFSPVSDHRPISATIET